MSPPPSFHTGRSQNLWWMVNREFESSLEALGLHQQETLERWIEYGQEATRATSGRGQTQILELPDREENLILRRTLHGGWLGPFWRGRLGSFKRIQRELEVTSRLRHAGASVPCPALGIAMASGPLWRASMATVYIPDTVTALDFLSEAQGDAERMLRVASATGETLGHFHGCGGQHADLHAGNILVREEGTQVQAWVIDLDKAQFDDARGAARPTELKRLAHSLEKRNRLESMGSEIRSCFREAYKTGLQAGLSQGER